MNAFELFVEVVRQDTLRCKATIEKHVLDLQRDPRHAMRWQGDAARAAAQLHVLTRAQMVLEVDGDEPTKMRELVEITHREMVYGARNGSSSTCPFSNAMDLATTAAWADLWAQVQAHLRILERGK